MTAFETASTLALSAAAALSIAFAPGQAFAQAADVLTPPSSFDEAFVGANPFARTQTVMGGVGRIIVGMRLGAASSETAIDLAALRVAVPDGEGDRLCVTLATSDGSYSARSEHALEARYAAPPRLGLATDYADALSSYAETELLVQAERAADCGADAGGVAAPAVATAGAGELVVSINIGRGRPTAWLEIGDAPATEKARCRRQEMVAKSHDCAIPIADLAPGAYEVVVDTGRLDGPSLTERIALELR
ncbi:MAG: hypothetical protein AAGM38_06615 [Pseudomonadota bacterium]